MFSFSFVNEFNVKSGIAVELAVVAAVAGAAAVVVVAAVLDVEGELLLIFGEFVSNDKLFLFFFYGVESINMLNVPSKFKFLPHPLFLYYIRKLNTQKKKRER